MILECSYIRHGLYCILYILGVVRTVWSKRRYGTVYVQYVLYSISYLLAGTPSRCDSSGTEELLKNSGKEVMKSSENWEELSPFSMILKNILFFGTHVSYSFRG